LDAHPQIEIRLFNAWRARGTIGRALEFTVRMGQLNHRMHNKVLIADGHFAILGGRNIGDRYFGVYDRFVQNDIDLMVAGTLLVDVRESFERYWRSPLSRTPFDGAPEDEPEAAVAAVRALVES